MERNVREFLRETGAKKLKERKVLSSNKGCAYLLQGRNLFALLEMMREQGVSKLVSHDGKWFLTADGKFANPKSRESKEGLIRKLEKPGNVFWGQNPAINPYFYSLTEESSGRYESTSVRPFGRISLDRHVCGGKPCIRGMPITVGEIVGMIARGHTFEDVILAHPYLEREDIGEALEYAAKRVSQARVYLFHIDIEQEEDGRWSADIPALAGCAAWSYTRDEALESLNETAQAVLEIMEECGDPIPTDAVVESRSLSEHIAVVTL